MTKRFIFFNLALSITLGCLLGPGSISTVYAQQSSAHMELAISFDVQRSLLTGSARLHLPAGESLGLHLPELKVTAALLSSQARENMVLSLPDGDFIHLPSSDSDQTLLLSYEKTVADSFQNLIDQRAIVLTSAWHPLPDQRITYSLKARVPAGFAALSESDILPITSPDGRADFSFSQPLYGLTFAAAPYEIRHRTVRDRLKVYTFFFPEDSALADGYLEAAAAYIVRYEELIGPFPFNHYVIAANLMPTGYGLPTFTLLGQQVLRLPFIRNTSLGHEILHSWFGNSVEVLPASGNWAEGLTTYLADLAYREESGDGAAARRETIQAFLSYVHPATPPLQQFRGAGHDSAFNRDQRAVGYSRSAMLFHELHERFGSDAFSQAIRRFYADFSTKQASWEDIRMVFEAESGEDLQRFFSERLKRIALPEIAVDNVRLDQGPTEAVLSFTIVQKQEEPFELLVPIRIETIAGVHSHREKVTASRSDVSIALDSLPTALLLDPEFNLMRRPSTAEQIPTWSQIMGAESCLVIVADKEQSKRFEPFLQMAEEYSWKIAAGGELSRQDMTGKSLVFLGTSSEVSRAMFALPDHPESGFTIDVRINPFDRSNRVALISSSSLEESQLALNRLSHYGKYSFLHFAGGRAVDKNIASADYGVRVELQELPSGNAVSDLHDFDALIDKLVKYRVIYIGETHTSRADHLLQRMIIEAVHARKANLAIGMEMFPASSQEALDRYLQDSLVTEADFLQSSRYYDVWGYDYRLFRPIFSFARKQSIPVIGLNLEREIVSSVFQSGGTEHLSDSQNELLPTDRRLDLPGYLERLTATHSMHQTGNHADGDLSGFIEAQALWDESMAASVAQYLQEHPSTTMIVIAGSQHTRKDSGIPPRVARRIEVAQATVANLATSPLSGQALHQTTDYLFLLEAEDFAPQGQIGIVLEEKQHDGGTRMEITGLNPQSAASDSGIQEHDLLIGIEGQEITTMHGVRAAMLGRMAGDTVSIVVRRMSANNTEEDHHLTVRLFNPQMTRPHP